VTSQPAGSSSQNNGGGGGADAGAKGSSKTPLPKPATLNESPLLANMVKAGSLPAIDDRVGPELQRPSAGASPSTKVLTKA